MGDGSWKRIPDERAAPIAASVRNVRRWAFALFNDPTPLRAFGALDMPVLYMLGERSTRSAQGVARLLAAALPRVEVVEFAGLGHMGPVTDPGAVNGIVAQFLDRHMPGAAAASLSR